MIIGNRKRNDIRSANEVKIYQIKSDTRKVTKEEQEGLSERMKSECAGKTVVVSSVETIREEEFLAQSDLTNSFNRSLQRVNITDILQTDIRNGCNNLFVRIYP